MVPTTGELIHLNADTTELAAARDNIDEAIGSWSTTRSILDEELTNRMDAANRRSAKVGPFTIEVNAPEKVDWDGGSLYRRLQKLVADGELDGAAVAEAVERTTVYKVNAAAARRLLGHVNAKVREAAEYASHAHPQRRNVRVRRTLP